MGLLAFGVPFDVVFSLDPTMRKAMIIAHGINQGGTFDFNGWQWQREG